MFWNCFGTRFQIHLYAHEHNPVYQNSLEKLRLQTFCCIIAWRRVSAVIVCSLMTCLFIHVAYCLLVLFTTSCMYVIPIKTLCIFMTSLMALCDKSTALFVHIYKTLFDLWIDLFENVYRRKHCHVIYSVNFYLHVSYVHRH